MAFSLNNTLIQFVVDLISPAQGRPPSPSLQGGGDRRSHSVWPGADPVCDGADGLS